MTSPHFVHVQDEDGKFNFDQAEVRNPETGELVSLLHPTGLTF